MGIGIALLSLLGIGLIVSIFDDDDDNETAAASEPEGVVRNGTDDADTIDGTDGTDLLSGGAEDDTLSGGASSDTLEGGTGDDLLEGNGGNDRLLGQADDDVIVAGGGNDVAAAGSGNDFVQGRGGDDTLNGSLGIDWLEGNDGNDSASGGFGNDTILGGDGADTLNGEGGNDILISGELSGTPFATEDLEALRDGTTALTTILNLDAETAIPLLDDDAADVLNGGDGDDALVLGAGDIGTGGEGEDGFALLAETADSDAGPSTITDFNSEEDALVILVDPNQTVDPVVDVVDENGDAIITVNGTPISVLVGAAGQIESADIGGGTGIVVGLLDPRP
ncbi:hypothetical protein KUV51_04840 [Tateyamaria omphalii]|uniref:calcium-binding protein n=1 Tax=Tateyamaria omphalii TaxID=299262 RepID=UPI001C9A191B|nr:calcium-binding protein [Tateyamaria omphalii]MBY5932319.1 hypothetical protein [Tateyamaria omphalii]